MKFKEPIRRLPARRLIEGHQLGFIRRPAPGLVTRSRARRQWMPIHRTPRTPTWPTGRRRASSSPPAVEGDPMGSLTRAELIKKTNGLLRGVHTDAPEVLALVHQLKAVQAFDYARRLLEKARRELDLEPADYTKVAQ